MDDSDTADRDAGLTHLLAVVGFVFGALITANFLWTNAELLVGDTGPLLRSGLAVAGGLIAGKLTAGIVAWLGGFIAYFL